MSGERTESEWRKILSAEEYHVLREAGTEAPFTGELLAEKRVGTYRCRACGNILFESGTKFEAHCGWPSFYAPEKSDAVIARPDDSLGMRRTEVLCANCGSHLGHVFPDGFGTPTGNRFCMNSVALTFEPGAEPTEI